MPEEDLALERMLAEQAMASLQRAVGAQVRGHVLLAEGGGSGCRGGCQRRRGVVPEDVQGTALPGLGGCTTSLL